MDKQRVDSADLHTASSAGVANFCGGNVILSVGLNQWQRAKALNDGVPCLRATEALQKLLENQPCRDDSVGAVQGLPQGNDFLGFSRCVSAQRQRPNAGVNKKRHDLERSAL